MQFQSTIEILKTGLTTQQPGADKVYYDNTTTLQADVCSLLENGIKTNHPGNKYQVTVTITPVNAAPKRHRAKSRAAVHKKATTPARKKGK